MGPGPGNPHPAVVASMTEPMVGHLDPAFLELLDETNDRLRTAFGTDNALTFPVSGTGSAGMEIGFVNLVRPGDAVVVGVNGVFGGRMVDVAERCGAEVIAVEAPWGEPVPAEDLLAAHPAPAIIAVVHAETSTGVRTDIEALGAGKGDAVLLVDCVTSIGGIPLDVDAWGIDIAYAGTQKCLAVPPGLAPLTVSARARERLVERPRSWYLDLGLIAGYIESDGGRAYHHTAPISMIRALHAGLGALLEEGLDAAHARHAACGSVLQRGLVERGFELFAAEGHRLPQLTTAVVPRDRLPEGCDEADVRRRLLDEYRIEIGGGLGSVAGTVWRIGCMGHTARLRNVTLLLAALDEILQ
jgi:alanine-glyoxylate transaminase/serine-glyoxylate transaminase/serine-pyruvate transaminase